MDFAPKTTFAKSAMAEPWNGVVSSELFRQAAGAAMLQMQANQGYAKDGFEIQRNAFQLEGARTFLSILMNLSVIPQQPERLTRSENLNHSV
jgi:hypothetical protein